MGRFVAFLGLALGAWCCWFLSLGHVDLDTPAREDMLNLSHLVGFVIGSPPDQPLAKDGRIDVYGAVLGDYDAERCTMFCRSAREDVGTTVAEVEARDYSRFPYERWRGRLPDVRVPLLWERELDAEGLRLVAFSDGRVKILNRSEWTAVDPGQSGN